MASPFPSRPQAITPRSTYDEAREYLAWWREKSRRDWIGGDRALCIGNAATTPRYGILGNKKGWQNYVRAMDEKYGAGMYDRAASPEDAASKYSFATDTHTGSSFRLWGKKFLPENSEMAGYVVRVRMNRKHEPTTDILEGALIRLADQSLVMGVLGHLLEIPRHIAAHHIDLHTRPAPMDEKAGLDD